MKQLLIFLISLSGSGVSDYSIVVPDDRKIILKGLEAKGVLVNQKQGTKWLKMKLENLLKKRASNTNGGE